MIIFGIDPGTATTGYGVIKSDKGKLEALAYGCIRTKAKQPLADRLFEISRDLTNLIKKYKPDALAVESLFFYKNITTAISVSHARGVVLLCAAKNNLELRELTPLQVKKSLTGYGKAEKKQVQYMVRTLLNLKSIPKPDDAADALAIALCATNSSLSRLGEG